jgi:hypothetical protein
MCFTAFVVCDKQHTNVSGALSCPFEQSKKSGSEGGSLNGGSGINLGVPTRR